jgi:amidohydrolase
MQPSTEALSRERLLDRLFEGVRDELAGAADLRERLHARPELSNREHETAATVLRALGADAARRVAGTGIMTRLGPAGRGAVAVRAELDAVHVRERTGAAFAAAGETMHACGHDVHMAALVALFRAARRIETLLPAPLVALFQPSEEDYPSGAGQLLEDGDLDGIDSVVAAHVHPDLPAGAVTADDGPVNAASDNFLVTLRGHGGHAAYPHRSQDSIVALAELVLALQTLVSRTVDPLHGAVVTVGRLEAGSAENVIPETAGAAGTIRALDPDDRRLLQRRLREMTEHIAAAHGCRAEVAFTHGEPAIVNDPALTAAVRPLLERAGAGPGHSLRSCGSDDFGFYGAAARLLLVFVGMDPAPGARRVGLHHPEFLPAHETLEAVARAQACAYVAAATAGGG